MISLAVIKLRQHHQGIDAWLLRVNRMLNPSRERRLGEMTLFGEALGNNGPVIRDFNRI